jgi:hypothetical protein
MTSKIRIGMLTPSANTAVSSLDPESLAWNGDHTEKIIETYAREGLETSLGIPIFDSIAVTAVV